MYPQNLVKNQLKQNHAITNNMVKSDNFGHQVNSDSDLVCFIFYLLELKYILNKQTQNPEEKAHKEPSHLDFHCLQMYVIIYLMSEVT